MGANAGVRWGDPMLESEALQGLLPEVDGAEDLCVVGLDCVHDSGQTDAHLRIGFGALGHLVLEFPGQALRPLFSEARRRYWSITALRRTR